MLELTTNPPPTLPMIANLFEELHQHEIIYCHWKGNEHHLFTSMAGDSDLDVLFDEKQKVKLEAILNNLGFKKFEAVKEKQYKGIVDFIGFDFQSGKLIHLHTHYKLMMGEPYLKGYHSDIEEKILESRVFNEMYGIYCIQPAFQLILLCLMEALKIRYRDILKTHIKNKLHFSEKVLREYDWLKANTTHAEVYDILKTLFHRHAEIYEIVIGDFNRKQLQKLAHILKVEFKTKSLYSPLEGLFLRWYREAAIFISRKLLNLYAQPMLIRRINPRGGVAVALSGAASVSAALISSLKEFFEKKIDVYSLSENEKISLRRKLFFSFRKFLGNQKSKNGINPNHEESLGRTLYKCVAALFIAREQQTQVMLMETAKSKGALVLYDYAHNDGPLLHHLITSPNLVFRAIAKMESKMYLKAKKSEPDILYKLMDNTGMLKTSETHERRESNHNGNNGEGASDNNNGNGITHNSKFAIVDASRPFDDTLLMIKQEIWKLL